MELERLVDIVSRGAGTCEHAPALKGCHSASTGDKLFSENARHLHGRERQPQFLISPKLINSGTLSPSLSAFTVPTCPAASPPGARAPVLLSKLVGQGIDGLTNFVSQSKSPPSQCQHHQIPLHQRPAGAVWASGLQPAAQTNALVLAEE